MKKYLFYIIALAILASILTACQDNTSGQAGRIATPKFIPDCDPVTKICNVVESGANTAGNGTGYNCSSSDFNNDYKVNGQDLGILASNYGKKNCNWANNWCSKVDINRDGKVDGADFGIFAIYYGTNCLVCYDTDGHDYQTLGQVYVNDVDYDELIFYENDSCGYPYYTTLWEWYCDADGILAVNESINCSAQFGAGWDCEQGKCVNNTQVTPTCFDSDYGENIYVRGFTDGIDIHGNYYQYYDACSGGGLQVNERYCYAYGGGMASGVGVYDCPYNCSNGACINQTNTTEWAEVTAPTFSAMIFYGHIYEPRAVRQLSGGRYNVAFWVNDKNTHTWFAASDDTGKQNARLAQGTAINGYYELDAANTANIDCSKGFYMAWGDLYNQYAHVGYNNVLYYSASQAQQHPIPFAGSCPNLSTCIDSDGGDAPYVQGTVTLNGSTYTDFCEDNAVLREYYCGTSLVSKVYQCSLLGPYHCETGACVKNQTNTTNVPPVVTDIAWTNPWGIINITPTIYDPDNTTMKWVNFQLILGVVNPSYYDYTAPYEWHYDSGGFCGPARIQVQAHDGIQLGTAREEGFNIDNSQRGFNCDSCYDSDGGITINIKASTYGHYNNTPYNLSDICTSSDEVMEYYCSGNYELYTYYTCSLNGNYSGCVDGTCI